MRQESNWMQNNSRIYLGNQTVILYQNQQIRQNQGIQQEKHWQQNQNQNFMQHAQISGGVSHLGGGMGIQAQHGLPVPTEMLIRAEWEKLMNQRGMW